MVSTPMFVTPGTEKLSHGTICVCVSVVREHTYIGMCVLAERGHGAHAQSFALDASLTTQNTDT